MLFLVASFAVLRLVVLRFVVLRSSSPPRLLVVPFVAQRLLGCGLPGVVVAIWVCVVLGRFLIAGF